MDYNLRLTSLLAWPSTQMGPLLFEGTPFVVCLKEPNGKPPPLKKRHNQTGVLATELLAFLWHHLKKVWDPETAAQQEIFLRGG